MNTRTDVGLSGFHCIQGQRMKRTLYLQFVLTLDILIPVFNENAGYGEK